jgi:nitroreductase
MDIYEAIQKRCSVRVYRDQPVAEEKLTRILDAGRLAPSGNNRQSRKFVVVRDSKIRAALAEAAEQPFVGKAPVVIAVVSTDPERVMSCDVQAAPVDCAIAIDHMTLAAVAEGLGSCWIGHFDQAKACQILGVPNSAKIIELMTLGVPDAEPHPKSRKSLAEIVAYERCR